MKIERETAEGRNLFTGYGEGYVVVNDARVAGNVIVSADKMEPDWTEGGIATLTAEHVARLLDWKPEIVLLGSGTKFGFPDPAALAPLYGARIGVEVMDTRAACRTYNILLAEGRNVIAALIVD
jgi:uncharacterized protein